MWLCVFVCICSSSGYVVRKNFCIHGFCNDGMENMLLKKFYVCQTIFNYFIFFFLWIHFSLMIFDDHGGGTQQMKMEMTTVITVGNYWQNKF